MGSRYTKAAYIRTDADGAALPAHSFGGIVGPLLRLQEGDTLRVHLTNRLPFAVGLHVLGGLLPVSASSSGVGARSEQPAAGGRRLASRAAQAGRRALRQAYHGESRGGPFPCLPHPCAAPPLLGQATAPSTRHTLADMACSAHHPGDTRL